MRELLLEEMVEDVIDHLGDVSGDRVGHNVAHLNDERVLRAEGDGDGKHMPAVLAS